MPRSGMDQRYGSTAISYRATCLQRTVDCRQSSIGAASTLVTPHATLQPVWNVFEAPSRQRYLAELQVDEASLLRGRGWTIFQAVAALPYYWETNPGMVAQTSHALAQVLADPAPPGLVSSNGGS